MWKFISSLIFLVTVGIASAQQSLDEVLAQETKPKFAPRSISVNYNFLHLTENLLDKPRQSQEVQAELGLHKYFLVVDLGTAETSRGDEYAYENSGNYWRIGMDANLSKAWKEGQVVALGLRYAKASFDDHLIFSKTLPNDADQPFEFSNSNLSSRWVELVFKMRASISKNLYTGYTMRYQFFEFTEGLAASQLRPFDIPGYGKTNRSNSFGFDYYIGWRIDIK